ncbi:MAG: type II toxin-antitoxin system VapC family toxin [Gammaproteobacteria bacterium]|nr:type II toxin-antitoxin system VapC family toxin [Gammaproteobacteria bacterium]
MNKYVLDASALLALLNNEPGAAEVEKLLSHSVMSTINAAEVIAELDAQLNIAPEEGREMVYTVISEIVPFTLDMAVKTAALRKKTSQFGLSLGDRACLALGMMLSLPVYTADRAWKNLEVAGKVVLIR